MSRSASNYAGRIVAGYYSATSTLNAPRISGPANLLKVHDASKSLKSVDSFRRFALESAAPEFNYKQKVVGSAVLQSSPKFKWWI
ncbi:hypothetical protein M3Y95_00912300 [Aphelenchoides besseyi]|nr:hypothetical protein M3Y95_00912300 [Aphelenchoides besseyi]